MPVLVLAIAVDFDKLFKNRSLATIAPLSKARRVVIVTIDATIMFIIAVLRAENCRAY